MSINTNDTEDGGGQLDARRAKGEWARLTSDQMMGPLRGMAAYAAMTAPSTATVGTSASGLFGSMLNGRMQSSESQLNSDGRSDIVRGG